MSGIRFLSVEDFIKLQNGADLANINFIDVRSKEEFDRYHLEGATLHPLSDINNWSKQIDRERMTLLYCQKGKRCLQAGQILSGMGFDKLLLLEGGVDAYLAFIRSRKG